MTDEQVKVFNGLAGWCRERKGIKGFIGNPLGEGERDAIVAAWDAIQRLQEEVEEHIESGRRREE